MSHDTYLKLGRIYIKLRWRSGRFWRCIWVILLFGSGDTVIRRAPFNVFLKAFLSFNLDLAKYIVQIVVNFIVELLDPLNTLQIGNLFLQLTPLCRPLVQFLFQRIARLTVILRILNYTEVERPGLDLFNSPNMNQHELNNTLTHSVSPWEVNHATRDVIKAYLYCLNSLQIWCNFRVCRLKIKVDILRRAYYEKDLWLTVCSFIILFNWLNTSSMSLICAHWMLYCSWRCFR